MNITDYHEALLMGLKLHNFQYLTKRELLMLARDAADAAVYLYDIAPHWRDECVKTGELAKQVIASLR